MVDCENYGEISKLKAEKTRITKDERFLRRANGPSTISPGTPTMFAGFIGRYLNSITKNYTNTCVPLVILFCPGEQKVNYGRVRICWLLTAH